MMLLLQKVNERNSHTEKIDKQASLSLHPMASAASEKLFNDEIAPMGANAVEGGWVDRDDDVFCVMQ